MINRIETEEGIELKADLWGSFLDFVQVFFPYVTGRPFHISSPPGRESHFITVSRELTKVARLQTKSLSIAMPPGYGKSTLVSMWIAWTLSRYPFSQYLYISYGKHLATKHTEFIRRIIMCREYRELFGVEVREDSRAKDSFLTKQGGSVKAFGSSGPITGHDAGLPNLNHFSGAIVCFPYDEYVHTENGKIKIGEIIEKRLNVKILSFNFKNKHFEYKEIERWITNPENEIIEVFLSNNKSFKCTPCHKIYTKNRGWIRADALIFNDQLLSPLFCRSIMNFKFIRNLNTSIRFISYKLFVSVGKLIKFWNVLKWFKVPKYPSFTSCYLSNNLIRHFGFLRNNFAINSIGKIFFNLRNNFPIMLCSRSIFKKRKSSMAFSIGNIIRFSSISKIRKVIISRISVKMPNFLTFLLRPNKSPSYQLMNKYISYFALSAKRNSIISFAGRMKRFFKNFSRNFNIFSSIPFDNYSWLTSNISKIRNTIYSLKSWNISPLLIKRIGHADKTYCLTIKDNHNFFVGLCQGVCVSNCDDMHKPDEVHSDTIREGVIQNYRETILQRPRGPNVPIIFIGHCLHEADLSAYIKSGQCERTWEHCVLKSLDDSGNALYPEINSKENLLKKQELNPYVFASQYQQDPIPAGGALFKNTYFPLLQEEPDIQLTFIVADTAETDKNYNDATVFSFFGLYKIKERGFETGQIGLHWLDCVELRIEPKDLENEFMSFYQTCMQHRIKPLIAGIEKKSTGVTLISTLNNMRGLRIMDIERSRASGSKANRFLEIQPILAARLVSFTEGAKHVDMCLKHMAKITANNSHRFDDICDTVTDACKLALIDKVIRFESIHDTERERILDNMAAHFNNQMNARSSAWRQ